MHRRRKRGGRSAHHLTPAKKAMLKRKFIAHVLRKGGSVAQAKKLMRGKGFWDTIKGFGKSLAKKAVSAGAGALGNLANEYLPGAGALVGAGGTALNNWIGDGVHRRRRRRIGRGLRL